MPASAKSSLRSSVRRAHAMQSLGLEDEQSFGSDEDLMETIGEIEVDDGPAPIPEMPLQTPVSRISKLRPGKPKSTRSLRSPKESTRSRKDSTASSLAASTHLLPPLPPVPSGSTLDLPTDMFGDRSHGHKRGSLMGAFKVKNLRKWRDDQSSKASFVTDSQSQGSTLSLSKIASNSSSRPSFSSLAYTSVAASPIVASPASVAPHLGPLYLPSFDNLNGHGKHDSPITPDHRPFPPRYDEGTPTRSSSTSWAPTEISHAILPAFPATMSSLEPITVITAHAARRPADGRVREGGILRTSARWGPCALVFSSFKVSLSPDEAARYGGDSERTVAHVHVFASQRSAPLPPVAGSPTVRRTRSNVAITDGPARAEIERRALSRVSTATVCQEYTDEDGREVVLRIVFGDDGMGGKRSAEWLIDMKDDAQLHEWIREIKKTAIMIAAEELGYGKAIRRHYETPSVSADELALKLSVHARAVAERRDGRDDPPQRIPLPPVDDNSRESITPSAKDLTEGIGRIHLDSSASSDDAARRSLDGVAGAALARSRSVDDMRRRDGDKTPAAMPITTHLQYPEVGVSPPSPATADDLLTYSNSGLALGGTLFPVPPSDLPRRDLGASLAASKSTPALNKFPPSAFPIPPSGPPMVLSSRSAVSPVIPVDIVETDDVSDDEGLRPPTPPRRQHLEPTRVPSGHGSGHAPSVASTTNSNGSSTRHLRRLRGKPNVIDIMAEFSAVEADNMPPEELDEPIRDDRERRIRFAEA